ncbi:MAG: molybdenum cofactor guanylyltransferase [Verrucomicrobiota bacterium]
MPEHFLSLARNARDKVAFQLKTSVEICILAGGQSSRMGRNKSQLRLGGKTLLAHIRRTAKTLNFPVRTIRRDLVPRCGPLGGVYTALKTTSADAVLFLACDMPLVSGALLEKLLQYFKNGCAIFTWSNDAAGFPLVLSRDAIPTVEKLLAKKQFSMQALATKTHAKKFRPGRVFKSDLLNINTSEDWMELKKVFSKRAKSTQEAWLVN